MKKLLILILLISLIIINNKYVYAQSSQAISYSSPQIYTVGSAITPLSPTSSGGPVAAGNYNTPTTFTSYNTPFGIAIDGSNNIYTTNNSTGDLTKFSSAGTAVFTVNTGDIQASEAAVDGLGNIYISQFTANSVLKYSATGTLLAVITGFSDPYGIAFDASNNAYVANYFSGNIIKIDTGTNTSVYLTGFSSPYGITIDNAGNMYVGEQIPGDIIKVATGSLARTTFASGFNNPRHLSKDNSGNIYVADFGNNAIKSINSAGQISTVLSTGLNAPRQGVFDASGNLYIANFGTNSLSKSTITVNSNITYSINPALPAGLTFNTTNGQITGTPSASVSTTTYTITATYSNSTTSTAQLIITVVSASSSNTILSNLSLSAITLSPVFSTGTGNYTANVPNSISSTTVTPVSSDPTATVTVNGTAVASGTASVPVSLNVGNNTITTIVTAQNGITTQSYTITVTRAPSSNAGLSNLSFSSGNLNPAFSTGVASYLVNVANGVSNINATPVVSDPTATVTVNGTIVAPGSASANLPLIVGDNIITTTVTAQDGVTASSYTVTVNRSAIPNAMLTSLSLNNGSLSPAFSSTVLNYLANVANNVNSIQVTPTTNDPTATITVNGVPVMSGIASVSLPLNVGGNTITTTVSASGGTVTQTYSIIVLRAGIANAALSSLFISNGSLNPAFNSATLSYSASVPNNVSSITLTSRSSDPTATVTVNGKTVAYGVPSAGQGLNVGNNLITTIVTAQDGITTQSYTLIVSRAPSSNASISGIALNDGSSGTQFSTGNGNYTVNAPYSISSVTLTPSTVDPTASVTVNGTQVTGATSAPVVLKVGNNFITTVVTAQDGITKQTYTVTVIRGLSTIASLSNLALSSGNLSPVFAAGTTGYTVNVGNATASVTLKPTTSDPAATVAVNGTAVTGGSASATIALKVGNNTIKTIVTAQDKTTKITYTTTVVRAPSSNAGLSNVAVGTGKLSPGFATATTGYTMGVGNTTTSIQIRPTTSDVNATLTLNGVKLPSGAISPAIVLAIGNNIISIVVTAQDGTTNSYAITVKRASSALSTKLLLTTDRQKSSTNANLASLKTDFGQLSPIFNPDTLNYNVTVNNSTSALAITPVASDTNATLTVNGTTLLGGNTSMPVALNIGENKITTLVTAQDGATIRSYTINVIREKPALSDNSNGGDKILVHQAVSPNGDGINDFLLIEGIEEYPGNKVTIFNSNGVAVYNTTGYDNSNKAFDGHSNVNGRLQQPGTYFYTIEYTLNGELRRKTGYFVLRFNGTK
ncbi:MAG TPA: cadherin-like beta sandwich domain-containing protein [Mucilaginibacter sp.]